VSGEPVPPAYFGSLQDAVDCEAGYQASTDFRDERVPEAAALTCSGRLGGWPD
jgi:hypothetical protein